MSWHVVETLAWRESAVQRALVKRGYDCWLPMCRSRDDQPAVPYFERYVFVAASGLPLPRRDTNIGILDLVRFGDSPGVMSDDQYEEMRQLIEPEPGAVLILNPRRRFKKGVVVRVLQGRFAGFDGIVRGSSKERIKVLFDILGKNVVGSVASDAVQALG